MNDMKAVTVTERVHSGEAERGEARLNYPQHWPTACVPEVHRRKPQVLLLYTTYASMDLQLLCASTLVSRIRFRTVGDAGEPKVDGGRADRRYIFHLEISSHMYIFHFVALLLGIHI